MRKPIKMIIAGALAALLVPATAAVAGPPKGKNSNKATIESVSGAVLLGDGKGEYTNVVVSDSSSPTAEDALRLYGSARRTFFISYGSPATTRECTGISNVTYYATAWWETVERGGQTRGTLGVWCETDDGGYYAVRYPGYPHEPNSEDPHRDDEDCILLVRGDDTSTGYRTYQVKTPDPAPTSGGGLLDDLLGGGTTPVSTCPAKVYSVDMNANKAGTLLWEGDAGLLIKATVRK